jgi:hypothetical protein
MRFDTYVDMKSERCANSYRRKTGKVRVVGTLLEKEGPTHDRGVQQMREGSD